MDNINNLNKSSYEYDPETKTYKTIPNPPIGEPIVNVKSSVQFNPSNLLGEINKQQNLPCGPLAGKICNKMDKKLLLKKLEDLYLMKEVTEGFSSQEACISWANKIAPLLQFNQQYYVNFIQNSHKLNLNVSSYTIVPALNIMKSQIQMAIEELKLRIEMEEGIPDQMYFSENSYLDIQKSLAKVIRQAQNYLNVFDPYMDEKIIEELSEVSANEIKLLTNRTKGLFQQRLIALRSQFPNKKVEVRKSDKSHDRFYIIDDDQMWTLGASLNKAGQKATLLSKIKSEAEKQKIIDDFNRWWQIATVIP